MTAPLEGYEETTFTHEGVTHPVFRRGEGPAVLVIHEMPGITPEVAAFGRRVADLGLTAALPCLFGRPGRPFSAAALAGAFARVCVSREFSLWARGRSSPVIAWLRALGRALHREVGGPGIGAVGMCLTGGFALAMMVDPILLAPVLSQPSLPLGLTRAHRASPGVSPEELDAARRRVRDGVTVLGLRFTEDWMCPRERFDTLRRELGEGFEAIEIDSSPGNPHGIRRAAHSVLTLDLVDREGHPTRAALDRALAFLRERLQA